MVYFKLTSIALFLMLCISTNFVFGQCNITLCNAQSKISVGSVYFSASDLSINLTNLEFRNVQCNSANYLIGVDIYVYQLLPDGTRDQSCNVLGQTPDNVLGFSRLDLGNTSFCGNNFVIDTFKIDNNYNFIPCDGAVYEIEAAIYVTTDVSFSNAIATVYNELSPNEYEILNLGTVTANINNVFTAGAQPLLINNISPWQNSSGIDTLVVPCNTDVPLFLQAQSIIADCPPYGDYSQAIPSEMSSIFVFIENGGSPQIMLDPNDGTSGGQQTGANIQGLCYGGIYSQTPYIFEAANVTQPCNNTIVALTLYLQDLYTNQTISNKLFIKYADSVCNPFLQLTGTLNTGNYVAADSIYSNANVSSNNIVEMQAQHRIKLTTGFKSGMYFSAHIDDCQ